MSAVSLQRRIIFKEDPDKSIEMPLNFQEESSVDVAGEVRIARRGDCLRERAVPAAERYDGGDI